MRTQVGRPGDPATRRPGDPATRRPGDPATRRPGLLYQQGQSVLSTPDHRSHSRQPPSPPSHPVPNPASKPWPILAPDPQKNTGCKLPGESVRSDSVFWYQIQDPESNSACASPAAAVVARRSPAAAGGRHNRAAGRLAADAPRAIGMRPAGRQGLERRAAEAIAGRRLAKRIDTDRQGAAESTGSSPSGHIARVWARVWE